MDPEEVQDRVHARFQRFRTAIEAEGGTVDRFIGDAARLNRKTAIMRKACARAGVAAFDKRIA
jgi:class 3 adenylate cyclase